MRRARQSRVADAAHPTSGPLMLSRPMSENASSTSPVASGRRIKIALQYRLGPLVHPALRYQARRHSKAPVQSRGTGVALCVHGAVSTLTDYLLHPFETGPGIMSVRKDTKSDLRFSRGPAPIYRSKAADLKPPVAGSARSILNTGAFTWMVPFGMNRARLS